MLELLMRYFTMGLLVVVFVSFFSGSLTGGEMSEEAHWLRGIFLILCVMFLSQKKLLRNETSKEKSSTEE